MCLAVPLQVTRVDASGRCGTVAMGNGSLDLSFELVDDVQVGDYVLVHAGMAIEKLDPEAARETLALFSELDANGGGAEA